MRSARYAIVIASRAPSGSGNVWLAVARPPVGTVSAGGEPLRWLVTRWVCGLPSAAITWRIAS
ncbi:hypothetical protein [Lentzea nigeriaca]|uniref:hypothetical protein n=1 Tax=Lentzea nigeriaca TaxID=1128665 RepID=UPI00195E477C|nr:hypothetical protein [Lentzea nigeriaca]MBM7861762.1 hypothetical protein [Lentzea nigeriaca]